MFRFILGIQPLGILRNYTITTYSTPAYHSPTYSLVSRQLSKLPLLILYISYPSHLYLLNHIISGQDNKIQQEDYGLYMRNKRLQIGTEKYELFKDTFIKTHKILFSLLDQQRKYVGV